MAIWSKVVSICKVVTVFTAMLMVLGVWDLYFCYDTHCLDSWWTAIMIGFIRGIGKPLYGTSALFLAYKNRWSWAVWTMSKAFQSSDKLYRERNEWSGWHTELVCSPILWLPASACYIILFFSYCRQDWNALCESRDRRAAIHDEETVLAQDSAASAYADYPAYKDEPDEKNDSYAEDEGDFANEKILVEANDTQLISAAPTD